MITHSAQHKLRLPLSAWPSPLIGFLVIKAVLFLVLGPSDKLALYGTGAYFFLLLLATGFAFLNAVERTQGRRLFWAFIAAGYGSRHPAAGGPEHVPDHFRKQACGRHPRVSG
jgi:hypothetical protein